MSKVWKISPKVSDNLIEQLLHNRGLKDKSDVDAFLNPDLDKYSKEFDLVGISIAIDRIQKAVKDQELIVIYGDYDVDGVCSSAIMYKALSYIGAKVLPYIPHREKEGYGLSKLGLDNVRDLGAQLVITVDNGIVAIEQALYAKSLGLEMIVTDHHEPLDKKPDCFVLVHTTRMCAAGVAWSIARRIVPKKMEQELLQFVAVATICDLIPLIGVNRALVVEGLKELNRTDNFGFKALAMEAGITLGSIGTYEIGYMLGPRLNAVGRLDHAIDALRLLCTNNHKRARELARLLSETNSKRQQLTADGVDGARLMIQTDNLIHVVASKDWNPGVIGLIAGKICEECYKPAIAISIGGQFAKGSARSIDGVNIIEVLRSCSDILVDVGGHSKAAGFTIQTDKIIIFQKRLEEEVRKLGVSFERILNIEAEVKSWELTKKLAKEMEDFEPFGMGNPRPVLATRKMEITDIRTVGEGKHLKLKGEGIDAIGFGMGEMIRVLKEGSFADVVFTLEINEFRGEKNLQLKVKDINF